MIVWRIAKPAQILVVIVNSGLSVSYGKDVRRAKSDTGWRGN
jgi:hypothetical protein